MTKQEQNDFIQEKVDENIFLFNCLYQEEIDTFEKTSKEDFEEFYKEAEENLKNLDESYCEPLFVKIITIATLENDFSKDLVIERYMLYTETQKFLKTEGHEKIYQDFGIVIPKKYDKEYSLDTGEYWKDRIIRKKLSENEGFILNGESEKDFEDIINQKWRDKSQMISSESLNEYTKQDEGIQFKHFLFCEEYLKTGKIKKTCELLGIGRTTAYNYLKEQEVQDYLKQRQEEIQKENEAIRKKTFDECFEKLDEIIHENYNHTSDTIKAIDTYLKHYSNIFMKDKKNEVQEQEDNC